MGLNVHELLADAQSPFAGLIALWGRAPREEPPPPEPREQWAPTLSLIERIGSCFAVPSTISPSVDYGRIRVEMLEEYRDFVAPRALRSLVKKATSIYECTAADIDPTIANALCRLSLEWWIFNSVLDHKCESALTTDHCRQLMLGASMMFWDAGYLESAGIDIHPLQRGFHATAMLCWARSGDSKLWIQSIASELLRYIFSRNIGVADRNETFDSADGALLGRRDDGGMVAQVLLTELAIPLELSDETRRSAPFLEAQERMSTLTCLLNDVASVQDDLESGALNVTLFLFEQECDLNDRDQAMVEALEQTCVMIEEEYERFAQALEEISQLQTDPPESTRAYAQFLRDFVNQYWQWQLTCPSYFCADHPVIEFRRGRGLVA